MFSPHMWDGRQLVINICRRPSRYPSSNICRLGKTKLKCPLGSFPYAAAIVLSILLIRLRCRARHASMSWVQVNCRCLKHVTRAIAVKPSRNWLDGLVSD